MKYIVTVEFVSRHQKEITVYAPSEAEAEDKACEIVSAWNGVEDTEAIDVMEAE